MNKIHISIKMLFKYIDSVPPLPTELEKLCLQQIYQGQLLYENPERCLIDGNRKISNILYQSWSMPSDVETWIRKNVTDEYTNIGLQVQNASKRPGDHLPHTDWADRRSVINWLIDTGGENVITSFYQEDGETLQRAPETRVNDASRLKIIESHQIQTHNWAWLDTSVIHGVTGITGCRISISIGFNHHDPKFRQLSV